MDCLTDQQFYVCVVCVSNYWDKIRGDGAGLVNPNLLKRFDQEMEFEQKEWINRL